MDPLAAMQNAPMMQRLFAYVLVHYRWLFVLIFLLPLSVLYDAFFYLRNKLVFKMRSAPKKHDDRVKKVQTQVRAWRKSDMSRKMCSARAGWQTMSFRVGIYKKSSYQIDVNLIDVLEVDTERRIVRVEPMVNMGQLTATLLPLGWTTPIVPELDDLTVGGLIMGTGVETSSHNVGLFQHICEAYELVVSSGELVRCTKTENSDLFYAIPWSYGTLGFLVAAEIKIVPAYNFVRVEYFPCHSQDSLCHKFKEESLKKDKDLLNDFVEGLAFSQKSGVVMTAKMTNQAEPDKLNSIGNFWKPWFFKHVESILKKNEDGFSHIEYIPLRHYYHRHSRSIFWEIQDIIPFGNNPLFRYMLGWAVPPKVSLLKLTQTDAVKTLYEVSHVIQDMLVPLHTLQESLNCFHKEVCIYPLWLCPFYLKDDPGMLQPANAQAQMYVDIGAYGVPKTKNFEAKNSTRNLEAYVRKVKGFQMLYADTYMTKDEFRQMFRHDLYLQMRKKFDAECAFPDVYDKVAKHARS